MVVISHIVQCYEQKIADELANILSVDTLTGNSLCYGKDLGKRDLFDLFSRDDESVN